MNQLYLGILSWSWGIFTMLNNNGVLCILELKKIKKFSWTNIKYIVFRPIYIIMVIGRSKDHDYGDFLVQP